MTVNGRGWIEMLASAACSLQNKQEEINHLNVFPVPDGDTGINMALTFSPVRTMPAEDAPIGKAASEAASLMLRSARGNSGAILSLFFRGVGKALGELAEADSVALAAAFTEGTAEAYRAVMNPTEGTILTVMRVMSEEAVANAARYTDDIEDFFLFLKDVAERALARTPELLPVLRQAHVVDAGGAGFVAALIGMHAAISGHPITSDSSMQAPQASSAKFTDFSTEDIRFAYCTECIIDKSGDYTGEGMADAFRATISDWGDSMVFVEDESIIKLHIHTNDPGAVLSEGVKYGALSTVKVENMRNQHTQLTSAVPGKHYAFVSVCIGEGIEAAFRDLGCDSIVSGGQSMNPSTDDILTAIRATDGQCVFVLPNNKNIFLVAKEAAALTDDRRVIVLETRTVPEGMTAMLAFDPEEEEAANMEAMQEAIGHVVSYSVTHAARNSEIDGLDIHEGQFLGLRQGKIMAATDTLEECMQALGKDMKNASFITVFAGEDASEEASRTVDRLLQECAPDAEIAVSSGGQPLYDFILSAE